MYHDKTLTLRPPAVPFQQPVYVALSRFIPSNIVQNSSQGRAQASPAESEETAPAAPASSDTGEVVALDPTVFAHPIRKDILHRCVVWYLDSRRQGSANTKTRGEIRGSSRKLRPQKGTGHARLGTRGSPMLRGGGVAFGPRPRDFSTKLQRKVVQMGMRVALSAKLHERSLGVVESLDWPIEDAKTKLVARRIDELGWRRTLFVSGEPTIPEGLRLSTNNLVGVDTVRAEDLNVYEAVKWPRLVLDIAAVAWFEQMLSKAEVAGGVAETQTKASIVTVVSE